MLSHDGMTRHPVLPLWVNRDGEIRDERCYLARVGWRYGRPHVHLGIGAWVQCAKVVAETLLPGTRMPYVGHRDGDQANNAVDNLYWSLTSDRGYGGHVDRIAVIVEYIADGYTQLQLAIRHDCSQATIYKILKAAGMKGNRNGKKGHRVVGWR